MKVVAHAEGGADVLQVVLDDGPAVLGDRSVSRVFLGLEVGEVRPRAEDTQRSQLAAVLVRHDIVGIVGARAGVGRPPRILTWQQAARDDAIGPVRDCARQFSRTALTSSLGKRSSLAIRTTNGGLRVDRGLRRDRRSSRNDSTWLYPSAQNTFDAIATAAVAPSGKCTGSNWMNHVSPLGVDRCEPRMGRPRSFP